MPERPMHLIYRGREVLIEVRRDPSYQQAVDDMVSLLRFLGFECKFRWENDRNMLVVVPPEGHQYDFRQLNSEFRPKEMNIEIRDMESPGQI